MREIPLTQGCIALIGYEDYELISKYKWYAIKRKSKYYAQAKVENKNMYMHRMILSVLDPKVFVDHENGNTLDNRRENLRICNASQNQHNRGSTKNSSSIFKGVSWHNGAKAWYSRIKINRKEFSIGLFDCEIEAAKAYDIKAKELHGDFARLNFPTQSTTP